MREREGERAGEPREVCICMCSKHVFLSHRISCASALDTSYVFSNSISAHLRFGSCEFLLMPAGSPQSLTLANVCPPSAVLLLSPVLTDDELD